MLYKNFAIYSTHIFLLAISSRDNVLVTVVIPKQALLQHKRNGNMLVHTEHSYFRPCHTMRSNSKVRHTCPHKEEREKTSWFPGTVVHYSVTNPAYPAALKPSSKMPSMATLGHRRRTEMLEIS